MAERRMFTKKITESDVFLDMPASTQMLYFHLSMNADDDGFVNNPKRIQRMCGASDDDFRLLMAKNFIIQFESGVIVIKHWKMHNYIQSDRYKKTQYTEEMALLTVKQNKAYSIGDNLNVIEADEPLKIGKNDDMYTECIQDVSVGKDSIGKDSIGKDIYIVDQVVDYLNQKTGKAFRSTTDKTRKLIKIRLKEGFSLEDFKKVIDIKTAEWGRDPKMCEYLRPETLFGTKFEGYLNQKGGSSIEQIEYDPKTHKFFE